MTFRWRSLTTPSRSISRESSSSSAATPQQGLWFGTGTKGAIVNIASIAGKQGKGAFLSDYVALVIEAYAPRLRGRRCSSSMTPPQVLDALAHAVWTRHREEVTDLTGGEPPQRQVLSILLHATSTRSRATTADEIQRSNRPRPSLDTTRQAWLRGGCPRARRQTGLG